MKNQRKISFQENKIKDLENQINSLKKENEVLVKENISLKNMIEVEKKNSESLNNDLKNIIERYQKLIIELRTLKRDYIELIENARENMKESRDKINVLLRQMRKQK